MRARTRERVVGTARDDAKGCERDVGDGVEGETRGERALGDDDGDGERGADGFGLSLIHI